MRAPLVLIGCLLAGCMSDTGKSVPEPSAGMADACGASGLQSYVGKNIDEVSPGHFGVRTRILPPDVAATMDYHETRLNIATDKNGIILRIFCG